MELKGKKILVVGAGMTGKAVAQFLTRRGARVTLNDRRPDPGDAPLPDPSIPCVWGGHPETLFLSMDLIVLSPGVPLHLPILHHARDCGIPIVGELELASWILSTPLIAVTGTNGKTTTTTLTGEILKNAEINAFVGGNIGRPVIELAESSRPYPWAVLEISSFQLATAPHFHPSIAAILNIEPDHLDWHPTLEDYVRSKWAIARNMGRGDTLVCYAPLRSQVPKGFQGTLLIFSETHDTSSDAYIRDGILTWNAPGMSLALPIRELPVQHPPLLLDMLAAGLLAHAAGVSDAIIEATLRSFRSLPHRLEHVGEINGIHFINDSKATNVDAVRWALKSLEGPIIWIAGGLWKGGDLSALFSEVQNKVRTLVAFGRDAKHFETTFRNLVRSERVATLEEAVPMAYRHAEPGDTVLLSPACASFDQFKNYKERGKAFAALVASLPPKEREESHALA